MEIAEPLSRRERERQTRRQAMLDAALAVFAENGYEGATIDEIAERAEFGKGTIYNYFPDGKEALFMTLLAELVIGGLHEVIASSFSDLDELATPAGARAAFRRFIVNMIQRHHSEDNVLLMFMKEGHRTVFHEDKTAVLAEQFNGVFDALVVPIEQAIASGALRPIPALPVAHLLMGNIRGYLMAELDARCDPSQTVHKAPYGTPDAAADFITTVLFDGLLAPDAA
ncbi:MAG: TetR/AcrR family transcriptional regulator [Bacteroidota bacterium]